MTIIHNKIGFHTAGAGGNPNGIGDYVRQLDAAGKAAVICCADGTVGIGDIANVWRNGSQVDHVAVWRHVPASVPDYASTSDAAAQKTVDDVLAHYPLELLDVKDRVWVSVGNELNKDDDEQVKWIMRWGKRCAELLAERGFRATLFGWASGTPEIYHWESDDALDLLRYAADNRETCSISLHEYSYTRDNILNLYPYLLGRFEFLFDVCAENNIKRPLVIIKEWGWEYERIASTISAAMADIEIAARIYAKYPEIIGACTWYLGSDYGNIHNETQKLIAPVTDLTINRPFDVELDLDPVIETKPPIDPENGARVDYSRTYVLLPPPLGVDYAAAAVLASWSDTDLSGQPMQPVRYTVGNSADDAGIYVSGLLDRKVIAINSDMWGGDLAAFYVEHYPGVELIEINVIDPADLRAQLEIYIKTGVLNPQPPAFRFSFWPTLYKVITQAFGVNGNYYKQFGLKGHEGTDIKAPDSTPLFAVADGTIYRVETADNSNYGLQVRIEHADGYKTVYAHCKRVYVRVGQRVAAGDVIALADNTGNSFGSHLHLTLKKDGATAAGDTDYPKDIIDPTPFLTLDLPLSTKKPPVEGPETPVMLGIHTSADSELRDGDAERLMTIDPQLIKMLSSFNEHHARRVGAAHPDATYIVRAFLKFWDDHNGRPRSISPQQFFNDTISDVRRTRNALLSAGVDSRKIWYELHNEPNLYHEGFGGSWTNGATFAAWLSQVIDLYSQSLTNLMFPGMSPGPDIPGVRVGHREFMSQAHAAAQRCDAIGVHSYWSKGYDMYTHPDSGLQIVDEFIARYPSKPIFITEASNNTQATTSSEKAREYLDFTQELRKRATVRGVTFFVLSASDPAWQWAENGSGEIITQLMADILSQRT